MATIVIEQYSLELERSALENMTDDEFVHFCEQNKHIPIERDKSHQTLFVPPASSESSHKLERSFPI